jgi:hypothetical protein
MPSPSPGLALVWTTGGGRAALEGMTGHRFVRERGHDRDVSRRPAGIEVKPAPPGMRDAAGRGTELVTGRAALRTCVAMSLDTPAASSAPWNWLGGDRNRPGRPESGRTNTISRRGAQSSIKDPKWEPGGGLGQAVVSDGDSCIPAGRPPWPGSPSGPRDSSVEGAGGGARFVIPTNPPLPIDWPRSRLDREGREPDQIRPMCRCNSSRFLP